MPGFETTYKMTSATDGESMVSVLARAHIALPGVYDHGLVTVVEVEAGLNTINDWSWFLNGDEVVLATTWKGDLFFWSEKFGGAFFLDTQRAKTTFIDKDPGALFNTIMPKDGFKEEVLFESEFETVVDRLGALEVGQCFIPTPWPLLGGSGNAETYERGDVVVYISLVGQTIRQIVEQQGGLKV